MGKSFAVAALIVGMIVGAGFVSGREIISFFGANASPWTAVPIAAFIFCVSALFLFIGARVNAKNISEVNQKLAGKYHVVADAFLLVNSFIVLAGMLAAMDSLGARVFLPVKPAYSIAAGILCVFMVLKGVKGLIHCNKAIVPVMAAALVFVGVFTVAAAGGGIGVGGSAFRLGAAVVYVCMNMVLVSTVITTMGRMEAKTILSSSAIAAVFMGGLVFVLIGALNAWGETSADMPVLEMAQAVHPALYYGMAAVIAASIFTTMLAAMNGLAAWFEGIFGNKLFSAFVILAGGFILSNLGFANVVKYLYPVIGVLGIAYTALGTVFAVRSLPIRFKIIKNRMRNVNLAECKFK